MSYYTYSFEAPVALLDYGPYSYTVIYVPPQIEDALQLSLHPRLRVEGEIADYPINAALVPSRQGRHVILSRDLLRTAGLKVGDVVEFRFNVADQDAIALPQELEQMLDDEPGARTAWEALTPGRRRGLAHLVSKLKSPESRQRKARDLIDALIDGRPLPGPPSRSKPKP